MWAYIFAINLLLVTTGFVQIISLDLGADQWVLGLCPKHKIYAVTHLATDPSYSYLHQKAQGIPQHKGQLEKLIDADIHLAVATGPVPELTKRILQKKGVFLIQLPTPHSVRDVAQQQKSLKMLFQGTSIQNGRLETLAPKRGPLKKRIFFYMGPNGMCPGNNTLIGNILKHLGCDSLPHKNWKVFSPEEILAFKPDIVLFTTPPPHTAFWKALKKQCCFYQVPYNLVLTDYPGAIIEFAQFVERAVKCH